MDILAQNGDTLAIPGKKAVRGQELAVGSNTVIR